MGTSVLSSADYYHLLHQTAWFVPSYASAMLYFEKMVFKVIGLFVTGAKEGLVTDVLSCVAPCETVMQPRNDFVVCLRR